MPSHNRSKGEVPEDQIVTLHRARAMNGPEPRVGAWDLDETAIQHLGESVESEDFIPVSLLKTIRSQIDTEWEERLKESQQHADTLDASFGNEQDRADKAEERLKEVERQREDAIQRGDAFQRQLIQVWGEVEKLRRGPWAVKPTGMADRLEAILDQSSSNPPQQDVEVGEDVCSGHDFDLPSSVWVAVSAPLLNDETIRELTKQIVEGSDGEVISLPYTVVKDALRDMLRQLSGLLLTQQPADPEDLHDLKFGPRSYTPEQAAVIAKALANRSRLPAAEIAAHGCDGAMILDNGCCEKCGEQVVSYQSEADPEVPRCGVELIAVERRRQVQKEGWTPEHDDQHEGAELVDAAVALALEAGQTSGTGNQTLGGPIPSAWWPWPDDGSWKPSEVPIANLVRAGALLAAEIDRLRRAEA